MAGRWDARANVDVGGSSDGISLGAGRHTFEAPSCGQGVHVGGRESGPGVVGG